MTRRFADLTPLEALQAAIAIERRNTELYRVLAETFQSYDGQLGEIFASMAREETQHRLELEAFLQRQFPGQPPTSEDDPAIEEVVEAPDLEEPEAFIFDNVTVAQAIEMAERAETHAFEFYQAMAQQVQDEGLRALCRQMAEVEAAYRETFARWEESPGSSNDMPTRLEKKI